MPTTMQNQLWCNEQVHSAENITIKLDQMHFFKKQFQILECMGKQFCIL